MNSWFEYAYNFDCVIVQVNATCRMCMHIDRVCCESMSYVASAVCVI